MSTWMIEPHEPLLFRDGRPFGLNPGARATSLPFPFPSTTTGGVRTQIGLDDEGIFRLTSEKDLAALLKLKVRGPLLVEISYLENGQEQIEWLAPAPADALPIIPEERTEQVKGLLKRLVPLQMPAGVRTDLAGKKDLLLVGQPEPVPGKLAADAPLYWKWEEFKKWLLNPSWERLIEHWSELGHRGPQREQRIHISMDVNTRTGKNGALFETLGMEFLVPTDPGQHGLSTMKQLGLAVAIGDDDQFLQGFSHVKPEMREGIATFGSERRLINWRRSSSELPLSPPPQLVQKIVEQKACRLILLTPAYFKNGCYPTEILQTREGVTPTLQAIAVQRPQIVSGWDIAQKKPRHTRRLAPAGSVLFLTLTTEDKDAIERWVNATWMQCVSDGEQDCNDGFGLAVIGTWNGQSARMETRRQA